MEIYHKGDQVHVTLDGASAPATVIFVSANGRNVLLKVDGFFYGSPMPVAWSEADGWREIVDWRAVEIRPVNQPPATTQ
jgi:hypothetical protein